LEYIQGDCIVIAPAVTLADKEYQMLRSASLNIIQALGVEGGCNCQFALNPESFEYAVIEAGAITIESPVCTPTGSKFSIEQTVITLPSESRINLHLTM